jgi:catechol 2,3-dioxygenase-like lactoylglutathione lyase family enzyme
MEFRYEVTVIPVSDVDRAKAFYGEQLGFTVDVDHRAGDSFRAVLPGRARRRRRRAVRLRAEGQTPGLHPERADYGTYLSFSDPDGNGWLVQEVGRQA